MKRKLIVLGLVLTLLLSLTMTGCGSNNAGTEKEDDKLIVGFVYIGPVNDAGWTQAHDEGKKMLEEELGVKTLIRENVMENASDVEAAMKAMIDQGAKVIFATSFGYMESVAKLAKEYKDVTFFHCSGYMEDDNFANYFGRIEQPRFLSGLVAGMKTKTNKLGYVAAMPFPEVIRGINAFTLGVRAVNPEAKVMVRWTNSWIDAAKAKDAAVALLAEGCDVLAQHQDTTSVQVAAQDVGAFAVGYDLDTPEAAPEAYMTAPIWNWGKYYVAQVKKIQDGTWKSEPYWGGMEDGIVDLAPLTSVAPEGAQAKVDEFKTKILDGTFDVFQGPIKDQAGVEKVKTGEKLSDKDQLEMSWFVEGVEGTIPASN